MKTPSLVEKRASRRELDRDQRAPGPGQRHAGQAEQVDLQAVAERHRHHGDAVDEGEAVEADAGGEPEVARAECGKYVVEPLQLGHRVRRRGAAGSSAWMNG